MNTIIEALKLCVAELSLHEKMARSTGDTDLIEALEAGRRALKDAEDTFCSVWSIVDITERAKELKIKVTKKQAREIAGTIERRHDATIGINWDVIDAHLYDL